MTSSFKQKYIGLTIVGILLQWMLMQAAHAALSHEISLKWHTLHSPHFEIHFHDGEKALAEQTANIAETLLIGLQKDLNWEVSDIIEIIISDEQDYANGFVYPLLSHLRMTIFPTAPNEFFDFGNWLELLIKHELSHVLHLDKSSGNPESLKHLFGRHPLLYPNLFQPAWLIEGYATYQETDREKGTGRGQSNIFHMMMRAEVENGIKPLNQVNLNIASWPIGTTRYLYGYYFYEFLTNTYGKESVTEFINNYSNNLLPYRLNHNAIESYGKTYEVLWQEFTHYINKKFKPEIEKIKSHKIVRGQQITRTGYFKLYAQPLDNGDLLYAEYDAINPPHLLLKNKQTNKTEKIAQVHIETQVDSHPDSGILLSQVEIYRNANAFFDLYHTDIKNKDVIRLTRGDRFRNAIWNPSGEKILAIYNKLGRHSLVILNKKGRLVDYLWEGQTGEYITGIDWSPDGKNIVAAVKRNHSSWNIEEFNIDQRTWKNITRNNAIEVQPQYSPDGNSLYFSADYDGVFNIQKLNLKTLEPETLTHVLGGAFSPKINKKGDLFYIGYSHKGYDIFHLNDAEQVKTSVLALELAQEKPPQTTYPVIHYGVSDYSSFEHLKPTWWTPAISGDDNALLIGAYTSGSDALNRHAYDAYIGFDTVSNSVSTTLNYSYDRLFPLFQTHFEIVNREKHRTDSYQFEVLAPLLTRNHRFYFGIDAIYEKNRNTIKMKNGDFSTQKNIDPLLGAGIIYDSRRKEIQSISPAFGRLITVMAETSDVFGGNVNGQMFTAKWKEYIQIKPQQVLAIKVISGFGLKSVRPFQLGGSISDSEIQGSTMLSTLPPRVSLYNRRRYALRGYPSDSASLIGRRMLMTTIEWRAPLKIIERSWSMLPIGLHKLSTTVFGERASIWDSGSEPKKFHNSLGVELNFHSEWFFFAPVQARLGYAYGFNENGEHQVYFTFGSSF